MRPSAVGGAKRGTRHECRRQVQRGNSPQRGGRAFDGSRAAAAGRVSFVAGRRPFARQAGIPRARNTMTEVTKASPATAAPESNGQMAAISLPEGFRFDQVDAPGITE